MKSAVPSSITNGSLPLVPLFIVLLGVNAELRTGSSGGVGGERWMKSTSITWSASPSPPNGSYWSSSAGGSQGDGRGSQEDGGGSRRTRRSLSPQEMIFMVDDHNAKRRLEPSSDMEHMKWNTELAAMALEWAKGCWWGHGQPQRTNKPFPQIGQNLYATTGQLDLAKAMRAWSDEEKFFYHYDTGVCDKEPCGHYTQVVWSTSREVGCAQYFCPTLVNAFRNGHYLVCNYGPAGNIQGIKPFKTGIRCTQCESGQFWCDNGLCRQDCTSSSNCYCGAQCQNQGCMTSDCRCICQDGFTGPDCSERCENRHAYCGANPGWPVSWCEGNENSDYVKARCPLMCGVCRAYTGRIGTCPTHSTPSTTVPPAPTTKQITPPLGTNKGVIIETSTSYLYWDTLWDSLRPVVTQALTDYCNDNAPECCQGNTPVGEDGFLFNGDNVFVGLSYPKFGRYAGEETTELLIYAFSRTGRGQCTGDTPQTVVYKALDATRNWLDQAVGLCCGSVLLRLRLGEEAHTTRQTFPPITTPTTTEAPPTSSTMATMETSGGPIIPIWAIAFLVVLLLGGAIAAVLVGLYWRRRLSKYPSVPPSSAAELNTVTSHNNNMPRDTSQSKPAKPPKPSPPPKPTKPPKPAKQAKPSKSKGNINAITSDDRTNSKDDILANFNGLVQERIQGFDNSAYYNS